MFGLVTKKCFNEKVKELEDKILELAYDVEGIYNPNENGSVTMGYDDLENGYYVVSNSCSVRNIKTAEEAYKIFKQMENGEYLVAW